MHTEPGANLMRLPFLLAASAVLAATCLVAGGPLHAWILKGRFRSVDEIAAAKNLLIVRVPARDPNLRPLHGIDGVMDFEVEVLSALRGPHRGDRRRVTISTTTELKPGGRYMLAGQPATRNGRPWLLFHWDLGVVELPATFTLASLKGKGTRDQVLTILRARRAAVQREMQALQKEKKLLEGVIPSAAPEKRPKGP